MATTRSFTYLAALRSRAGFSAGLRGRLSTGSSADLSAGSTATPRPLRGFPLLILKQHHRAPFAADAVGEVAEQVGKLLAPRGGHGGDGVENLVLRRLRRLAQDRAGGGGEGKLHPPRIV